MITLHLLRELQLPVFAECITPDSLRNRSVNEISDLRLYEGNRERKLTHLFKIDEVDSDHTAITIDGNVDKIRKIGARMTSGKIEIHGNAGMYLGEEMRGGKITVQGDAGSWAGSMMKGGTIEIHGNAGDYLAAPYRGSTEGMHGGEITVHGNVGNETAIHMKKGIIRVHGNAGQFLGFRMHDGTVFVQNDCEARVGACMVGGKIIIGGALESVLPTFTIDSVKSKVKVEGDEILSGPFYLFLGDLTEDGNGKLYVMKEKNSHLKSYEKYL